MFHNVLKIMLSELEMKLEKKIKKLEPFSVNISWPRMSINDVFSKTFEKKFPLQGYATWSDKKLPMLSLTTATSEMPSFLIFQFSLNSDGFLNFLETFFVLRKICQCPISLQETKKGHQKSCARIIFLLNKKLFLKFADLTM